MDEPTATTIEFFPPDADAPGGPWVLSVFVTGTGFVARGLALTASVGSEPVQGIFLAPDGTSFSGYLANMPADEDALAIGFMQEAVTDLVFHAGDVA